MVSSIKSSKGEKSPQAPDTAQTAVSRKASARSAVETSSTPTRNVNPVSRSSVATEKSDRSKKTSTPETQNETRVDESDEISATPKRLIWRDIYAEVIPEKTIVSRLKKGAPASPRIVLNSVSGYAEPGQITFLMGSSGAGKTTLLNILTQQQKGLKVYGEVAVNHDVMKPGKMRRISAYVQQEDLFIGELTVRETLLLNAHLRMPSSCTRDERLERVHHVSTEMGLEPCLGTKIGSAHQKSISKGEKKRLAFACELLTNPQILFCDEPTSGLDSFMALQVIRALKTLANEGKTIICSIHQPSSQVYELADRLVLLGAGGVAYQGPAAPVGEYFAAISYPCPQFVSVSDHFLTVLSHKPEIEQEEDYNRRVESILDSYSNSSLAKDTYQITHETLSSCSREVEKAEQKPEYAASWFTQFYWLLWRGMLCVLRNPMVLRVRLFQSVLVAIIIGVMNFGLKPSQDTLMNIRGVAYCSLRDMNLMFCYPCIGVFTAEMHIAKREYRAAMYRPSAYYIGRNIADTIQYFIFPFVYATIIYWMAGFKYNVVEYLIFWMVTTLMGITAASIGYAGACIFGNLSKATSYLHLFTVPMLVFGGLLIDLRTIPSYFSWFARLSWYRYAYESNIINFFGNIETITGCLNSTTFSNFTESSTFTQLLTSTSSVNKTITLGDTCFANGKEVLKSYDLESGTFEIVWRMLVMVFFIFAWRAIGMIALHIRMKRSL